MVATKTRCIDDTNKESPCIEDNDTSRCIDDANKESPCIEDNDTSFHIVDANKECIEAGISSNDSAQIQISCGTPEHYTPAEIVEPARAVLGGIDLDPASSRTANRVVRAARIYTAADCGQLQRWYGRVFVNPPGDPRGRLMPQFWSRACEHAIHGGPGAVVFWVGYSLEQLGRLQSDELPSPMDWPMVIARKRVRWWQPETRIRMRGSIQKAGDLRLEIDGQPVAVTALAGRTAKQIAVQVATQITAETKITTCIEDNRRGYTEVLLPVRGDCTKVPVRVRSRPRGLKVLYHANQHPTHGNYFCLLGGSGEQQTRFRDLFSQFGQFLPGRNFRS